MFPAVLSGVIVGLICLHLPESANSFIIDNVVSPLRSKILGAVSGIMGPVILYPLQPPLSRWAALTISHISACTMTYNMFEELEAAHKLGGMKEEAPDSAGEQ